MGDVMRLRADARGISLTEADAGIVKGMLLRGDRQHDIAAWFGVNGGRIAEIATGRRYLWVAAVTTSLPPVGPYSTGRHAAEAQVALEAAIDALAAAETALMKTRGAA